jgi:AICAR transformylase/IMP cyclohydrolase PurH
MQKRNSRAFDLSCLAKVATGEHIIIYAYTLYTHTLTHAHTHTHSHSLILTDSKRAIPAAAMQDLVLASITLKYTQSNSIAYAIGGQVIGVGAGQQSRVDCVKLAARKVEVWYLRQRTLKHTVHSHCTLYSQTLAHSHTHTLTHSHTYTLTHSRTHTR